jgi:hypothetical protein
MFDIQPGKGLNLLSKLNRILLILDPRGLWLFVNIIFRKCIEHLNIKPWGYLRRFNFGIRQTGFEQFGESVVLGLEMEWELWEEFG